MKSCYCTYGTNDPRCCINAKKCDKELPNGEKCGKPYGYCIHKFIGTKFGLQK